jgi:hypothetical protein
MYWHGVNRETGKPRMSIEREGHLWLAKSYDDWHEECGILAEVARKGIARMVERGLLVKRVWKFNGIPMTHIRVDPEGFETALRNAQIAKSIRYVVPFPSGTTSQMEMVQRTESLTETTTETTAENTSLLSADGQPLSSSPLKQGGSDSKNSAPAEIVGETPQENLRPARTEKQVARDALMAAVENALRMKDAPPPLVSKYVSFMTGTTPEYSTPRGGKAKQYNGDWYEYRVTPGMDADEINAFAYWLQVEGISLPLSKPESIALWVSRFRADMEHDAHVERERMKRGAFPTVPVPPAANDDAPMTDEQRMEVERLMAAMLSQTGGGDA